MPSSRVPKRSDGTRDAAIMRAQYRTRGKAAMPRVGGDVAIGNSVALKKLSAKKQKEMFGRKAKTGTSGAKSALR